MPNWCSVVRDLGGTATKADDKFWGLRLWHYVNSRHKLDEHHLTISWMPLLAMLGVQLLVFPSLCDFLSGLSCLRYTPLLNMHHTYGGPVSILLWILWEVRTQTARRMAQTCYSPSCGEYFFTSLTRVTYSWRQLTSPAHNSTLGDVSLVIMEFE